MKTTTKCHCLKLKSTNTFFSILFSQNITDSDTQCYIFGGNCFFFLFWMNYTDVNVLFGFTKLWNKTVLIEIIFNWEFNKQTLHPYSITWILKWKLCKYYHESINYYFEFKTTLNVHFNLSNLNLRGIQKEKKKKHFKTVSIFLWNQKNGCDKIWPKIIVSTKSCV